MTSATILSFYDETAETYIERTADLDMTRIREAFVRHLKGARVLDAGCGSGRDALAFKRMGLDVVAFDGSERMAELAAERTGLPVQHLRFDQVQWDGDFDGVWACSSLLHLPDDELHATLRVLLRALHPGGVLYASFKAGNGARVDAYGRHFNDFTLERLREALERAGADVLETWANDQVGGPSMRWVNAVSRKPACALPQT